MIGSGWLTHCVCVFVISVERLWMIGVTDTACFLLGRSSQRGQTGGTRVYEMTHAFHLSIITTLTHIKHVLRATKTAPHGRISMLWMCEQNSMDIS